MDWVTRIQVAVAWADIILCEIGKALLYALGAAFVGALIGLVYWGKRQGKFARRANLSRPKRPGWHGSNRRFEARHRGRW
ncbi:MAG: hypothetical protein IJ124_05280 [Clostridia bacterium]|nr:hypothetical protein [Clostridia bacterium]